MSERPLKFRPRSESSHERQEQEVQTLLDAFAQHVQSGEVNNNVEYIVTVEGMLATAKISLDAKQIVRDRVVRALENVLADISRRNKPSMVVASYLLKRPAGIQLLRDLIIELTTQDGDDGGEGEIIGLFGDSMHVEDKEMAA